MNLFNRKTLKRHIKADPIPSDHLAALEAWAELISSGRIERLKETALHGQFASKIVEGVLGYHGPAGGADYESTAKCGAIRRPLRFRTMVLVRDAIARIWYAGCHRGPEFGFAA